MVNANVGGYTKTLDHRKILRKNQICNELLKTKRIIKPKYRLSGGSVFTFSLARGTIHPLSPRQLSYY